MSLLRSFINIISIFFSTNMSLLRSSKRLIGSIPIFLLYVFYARLIKMCKLPVLPAMSGSMKILCPPQQQFPKAHGLLMRRQGLTQLAKHQTMSQDSSLISGVNVGLQPPQRPAFWEYHGFFFGLQTPLLEYHFLLP